MRLIDADAFQKELIDDLVHDPNMYTSHREKEIRDEKIQYCLDRLAEQETKELTKGSRIKLTQKEICERTKAGMAASDKVPGRKTGSIYKLSDDLREDINRYFVDRSISKSGLAKKYGLSRTTVRKYIQMIRKERQENGKNEISRIKTAIH